jgi:tubulin-specific chaperone A
MPPPTQLSIGASSLQRLVKEEKSYHSEMEMQQKSIDRLEKLRAEEEADEERGNHEFLLRQEVCLNHPSFKIVFSGFVVDGGCL